ncbi:ABC transporter ATP-binding protein [Aminivibrio sp.]|uniref:ABC transporter ATP-binding protein n=1 Tax=Aminivibrio sp. TaxID=1872489 RepID=UPI001A61A3EE|nr:oligopeptide/dipeptide ABC transporter ATP-binding protein [Aminivibrio sp.]MBL3539969.1 ATP-binding cassette domain-containing protein [Aminivibrio sp.]
MDGRGRDVLLEVAGLVQSFSQPRGLLDRLAGRPVKTVHAVNGVSFDILRGEVFSLVGESGCGKTTTARTVVRLLEPKTGRIVFDGEDITAYSPSRMMPVRKKMQMIFQDPYASLNPRQRIKDIIMEPMLFHRTVSGKDEAESRMLRLLDIVGFRPEQADRYPHQFSGGQRQRVGIARALATNPSFIVADEPVSALDVSIQAQVLNLMMDLRDEFGLSYLFIAHDLSVVRHVTERLGIMYLGFIVEQGDRDNIFGRPLHPYTEALLAAAPTLDRRKAAAPLQGDVPSPIDLPPGCPFAGRCPRRMKVCDARRPSLQPVEGRMVACHLYGE